MKLELFLGPSDNPLDRQSHPYRPGTIAIIPSTLFLGGPGIIIPSHPLLFEGVELYPQLPDSLIYVTWVNTEGPTAGGPQILWQPGPYYLKGLLGPVAKKLFR